MLSTRTVLKENDLYLVGDGHYAVAEGERSSTNVPRPASSLGSSLRRTRAHGSPVVW